MQGCTVSMRRPAVMALADMVSQDDIVLCDSQHCNALNWIVHRLGNAQTSQRFP
jgi:hypothetical protein